MIKLRESIDLSDFRLIIPSVAVGNVGQLSLDLIIASLNLKRIGHVLNSTFIHIIGADPYDEDSQDLCTAVDVFANVEKKIVAVQIRSPLAKSPASFFKEIIDFVKSNHIKEVIILTSSFAHEKRDEQLRTVPLRYEMSKEALAIHGDKLKSLGSWIKLEPKVVDFMETQDQLQIPGGGFAKNLFELLQQHNVPSTILLRFCMEGDNIPDAVALTDYADQLLEILERDNNGGIKVKFPPSWKFLFGNPPPRDIY